MSPLLKSELDRILAIIKTKYRPEKVIFYGSAASGRTNADSDLDLVIIKQTTSRFYDRIGEVLRLTQPSSAVDLLVYTPQEYETLKHTSWFIGEEIDKKGKVLYAV